MTESNAPEASPSRLARVYDATVLRFPILVVLLTAVVVAFFLQYFRDFDFDASSEAIVLENDADLRYYNYSREIFGSDDYVVLALTREGNIVHEGDSETLAQLEALVAEFLALEHVSSVMSILNVPLFHSKKGDQPDISLMQAGNYLTLLSDDTDHDRAAEELTTSPLYKDYLISIDGKTTAIQINFAPPEQAYLDLYNTRARLRDKRAAEGLTGDEQTQLDAVDKDYVEGHTEQSTARSEDVAKIREIMGRYESLGTLHLGGVPMVIADIIAYAKNDIFKLGIAVVLLVLLVQVVIFRELKWIILPTLTCVLVVVIMIGYLGYEHWRVTIITSNFPSLLLVITIAMAMHIAVRYRELYAANPDATKRELTLQTVQRVAKPCLFTSSTTMVGFGSLLVSQMRPVMDFGLIMVMGLGLAYCLCFLFLPAALLLFPKGKPPPPALAQLTDSPMAVFARITERKGWAVALGSVGLFLFCLAGLPRLQVENSFVDYFRDGSPIREGMMVIDQRLGGTTPLEVVLEAPEHVVASGRAKGYWLEDAPRARLREIHEWLDALPQTGKVISPDTMVRVLEKINGGKPVPKLLLQMALRMLPPEIIDSVIGPYMSADRDIVRISMRVRESNKDLKRKELIDQMNAYFFEGEGAARPSEVPAEPTGDAQDAEDADAGPIEEAHITGVFVLYNNLLQSLVDSQIRTIGMVFAAIWLMFLILFRSPSLATIAIVPNVLPVIVVLGALAWLGIPLDMMTIMIAAITLGIAVDHAIHYLNRFKEEFTKDRDYIATMYRCHNSVGRAVYYTSITIVAGFSILTVSNFVPNIYFGLFTSIAMVVAMVAAVTLLPLLLITFKPFGPGQKSA